jgi:hypothetical protein
MIRFDSPGFDSQGKVTAEITTLDVLTIARDAGVPLTESEAAELLRDGAAAHLMWKQMIEAGRSFIAGTLAARSALPLWLHITGEGREEYDA